MHLMAITVESSADQEEKVMELKFSTESSTHEIEQIKKESERLREELDNIRTEEKHEQNQGRASGLERKKEIEGFLNLRVILKT